MSGKSALFIMPRSSRAWRGSEALWITAAGWASAAERIFGHAQVLTTDRISSPEEVWNFPLGEAGTQGGTGLSNYLPGTVVTLLKDLRLYQQHLQFMKQSIPAMDDQIQFVWEQHDLFTGYGRKVADAFHVPLITYVHAPTVWEAAKWGVTRPITGHYLEKSETRNLQKSDLVACVSQQVRDKLVSMGVQEDRVIISPMSVAAERFQNMDEERERIRRSLGLKDKFVFGWTGSFRGFHGLNNLLKVFASVSKKQNQIALLLVGDGKERQEIEHLAKTLGIEEQVILPGRKDFDEIPAYVSAFDAAIVSASKQADFHYSPLKLREYMAAGKATLAPDAGEIPVRFANKEHLHIYSLDSDDSLFDGMMKLINDTEYRERLGTQGKQFILENGTWENEVRKIMNILNIPDVQP